MKFSMLSMLSMRSLVATAALLVAATASADPQPTRALRAPRTARLPKADVNRGHPCLRSPVEVAVGAESATFALARCDGKPAPLAVDELSVLARPARAPKPKQSLESLAQTRGAELAPGIRRVDPRLVERLQLVVDHFRKAGQPAKVVLVSGYRPRSAGSYHAAGRALDFRVDGVKNEALISFCKTLPDTGCGYYPNSGFVHMDVRDPGAGHVAWIDVSRPGEAPKYVSESSSGQSLPSLPAEHEKDGLEEKKTKTDPRPYFF
jgi:hypothetical protein